MSVTVVIQARMGSSRLPGKVLRPLAGRTPLGLMIERLAPLNIGPVVIATSDSTIDDAIAGFGDANGIPVIRGPEVDVLARFGVAVNAYPAHDIVRLTADCPLIDPQIVADVVAAHQAAGVDYTSNTLLRTYPDGLDVEVFTADALARMAEGATTTAEREHVTVGFSRHPEVFALAALLGDLDLEDERWTIDTADDFSFVDQLLTDQPALARASWLDIFHAVGPQRDSTDGLVLRVGRPTDSLEPPAHALLIGSTLTGSDEERLAIGDPGARTWSVRRNDRTIGAVTVPVVAGHGQLAGWLAPADESGADAADLPAAIEHRLMADLQVTDLSVPIDQAHPLARSFASAGFEPNNHGGITRRRLTPVPLEIGATS